MSQLRLQLTPTRVIEIELTPLQEQNNWGRKVGNSYIYTKVDGERFPLWKICWTVTAPNDYRILTEKTWDNRPETLLPLHGTPA